MTRMIANPDDIAKSANLQLANLQHSALANVDVANWERDREAACFGGVEDVSQHTVADDTHVRVVGHVELHPIGDGKVIVGNCFHNGFRIVEYVVDPRQHFDQFCFDVLRSIVVRKSNGDHLSLIHI